MSHTTPQVQGCRDVRVVHHVGNPIGRRRQVKAARITDWDGEHEREVAV
jgi:hypothetical protein